MVVVVRGSGGYAGRIMYEGPGREENRELLDRPSLQKGGTKFEERKSRRRGVKERGSSRDEKKRMRRNVQGQDRGLVRGSLLFACTLSQPRCIPLQLSSTEMSSTIALSRCY